MADAYPQKGPLKEFSVVYTDRVYNLMSSPFQQCMKDLSAGLKEVYNGHSVALIPGSGTFGMEACARQFGKGKKVLVLRNGFFSFRWSAIFDQGGIATEVVVVKAKTTEEGPNPSFAPLPLAEIVAKIKAEKPGVVYAPHVETSTGIIFNDEYLKGIAEAVHSVGGFFVLDGIAAGNVWVDMKAIGIDAYITAPQKGWTGPACVGIVILGEAGRAHVNETQSDSFSLDLKKWCEVMDKYDEGAFMYYTTLPTDALMTFRDVLLESKAYGYDKLQANAWELGKQVRAMCVKYGYKSVSAEGFQSPGVVVSYSTDAAMVGNFKGQGIQIAGGVPFKLDEPEGLITFRLGLFGLDKLMNIPRTVAELEKAFEAIAKK